MIKYIKFEPLSFCLCLFFSASAIFSQQVSIKPFEVNKNDLINDLAVQRKANPLVSAEQFVTDANALLAKQGLNFEVAFNSATCGKIATIKNSLKNPAAPLNLRSALTSSTGEKASLLLPAPIFNNSNCTPCYIQIPLLEATTSDFVTLVQNLNVKFALPQNFIINEAALIDSTDLKSLTTRWKIPYRTTPLSVSDDGKILYLNLPDKELDDFALRVFSEGVFQFCTKKEIDLTNKGNLLKEFPKDPADNNLAFVSFGTGANTKTVRFSTPCGN